MADATRYIDYYAILKINKTANRDEIKKAYRRLAFQYHPDVKPKDKEAEARFKQINEAYEVLFNPEKRPKYDYYGQNRNQVSKGGVSSGAKVRTDKSDVGQNSAYNTFRNGLFGGFL